MKPTILMVGLSLILGSCVSAPPDVIASSATDSSASAPPIRYQSPIFGYVNRQPVDPKPWREQNQAQSENGGDAS